MNLPRKLSLGAYYTAVFASTIDSPSNPGVWKLSLLTASGLLVALVFLESRTPSRRRRRLDSVLTHSGAGMLLYSVARMGTAGVNPLGRPWTGRETTVPLSYIFFTGIALSIAACLSRRRSLRGEGACPTSRCSGRAPWTRREANGRE